MHENQWSLPLLSSSQQRSAWVGNNVQWNDTSVATKCLEHVESEHNRQIYTLCVSSCVSAFVDDRLAHANRLGRVSI